MSDDTHADNGDARSFRVTFRIDPPSHCPVKRVDGTPTNLWVDVADGEMRCDVMTTEGPGEEWQIRHFTKPLDEACPCRIFQRHGAIPQQTVDGEAIRSTVYLDSAELGQSLIADLTASQTAFDIADFTQVEGPGDPPVVTVDHSALTEKQRQALELAAELGYYEMPAAVTIEQMAEMLDISPSALGKRLGRAEKAIISQVTGRFE